MSYVQPKSLRYNSVMYVLKVRSGQREELVEFTDEVQQQLKQSGVGEGVVVLYVQHTTAGLTVNENADPDVKHDMLRKLSELVRRAVKLLTLTWMEEAKH